MLNDKTYYLNTLKFTFQYNVSFKINVMQHI